MKEAQKWVEIADTRWAALTSTPDTVLKNPITLTAQYSSGGWAIIFSLTDFKAKELFFRLDGKGEFASTGHLQMKNVQTGLPMIQTYVPLPNLARREVRQRDVRLDHRQTSLHIFHLKVTSRSE